MGCPVRTNSQSLGKDDESLTELSSFGAGGVIKESRYIKEDLVTEWEGYWRERSLEWLLAWSVG